MSALGDAPRVLTVADPEAAFALAGEHVAEALTEAVDTRGVAHWATTGGSAAPGMYRALAAEPARTAVPWADVHVWWGDDRFVPHDHELSNVRPFDELLRDAVALQSAHIHPVRTTEAIVAGLGAGWAAEALAIDLAAAGLATRDELPVLDLLVLGMGGDGHLLSVFPGSAALDAPPTEWALAIPAPTHIEPHVERVTMHPGVIAVARRVLMVTTGAGKADVLAEVFGPTRDPRRWPAQLALHQHCTWIVDEAAAARLPR